MFSVIRYLKQRLVSGDTNKRIVRFSSRLPSCECQNAFQSQERKNDENQEQEDDEVEGDEEEEDDESAEVSFSNAMITIQFVRNLGACTDIIF